MKKYDIGLKNNIFDPLSVMLSNIKENSTVLEFGCANGRMTKYMKHNLGCKVYIVEYDEELFHEAIQYAEDGICGDIMEFLWVEKFQDVNFDYVIFADVLEHLPNPEKVLEKLKKTMKDTCKIWISVPNIAHNDVLIKLFEDKFDYTQTGLLDNTHIHFFTLNSAKAMFDRLGYKVLYEDCFSVPMLCTEQLLGEEVRNIELLNFLETREQGNVYQYIFEISQIEDGEVKTLIGEHKDLIQRRVYFDTGKGFSKDEMQEFIDVRNNHAFYLKIELPNNVNTLRIDPALRLPCKLKNLKAYTDGGEIACASCSGKVVDDEYILDSFEGSIYYCDLQEYSWISIAAEIEYGYEFIEKSNQTKAAELEERVNHLCIENNGLQNTIKNLEAEKSKITSENLKILKEIETFKEFRHKYAELSFAKKKSEEQYVKEIEKLKEELEVERKNSKILLGKLETVFKSKSWKITKLIRQIKGNAGDIENIQLMQKENITEVITETIQDIWNWSKKKEQDLPLVSVLVPNFNHEPYLRERLDSIYAQTYPNYEVILLDDCSTDNSREVLMEYAEKYSYCTKTAFNEINCGKVFQQWNKGIALARGSIIWIAESDDYCSENFLEEMVPLLADESVMLAFARSVFMQDGKQTWTTEEYLADIPELRWDAPFTMSAAKIVEKAFSIKNIIPNVSSTVFKNTGLLSDKVQKIWGEMKLSGDWIFYLNQIHGGCISYTNKTTNFYRVHGGSTSLKVQQTMDYYKEYADVCKYIASHYIVPEENYDKIMHNLKEHYKAIHHTAEAEEVEKYFNVSEIIAVQKTRKPNVIMACFALKSGGGETYPLYLANEMKRQGIAVTVVDFGLQPREESIRKLLHPSIPLVEANGFDDFYQIVSQLEGEVIHSHHASVDEAVSAWLSQGTLKCKQFITLHGMYETLSEEQLDHILPMVTSTCEHFIYIADKNLIPFKKKNFLTKMHKTKMANGLPMIPVHPIRREELEIGEDDFVLCLASRGIPEKGWAEAIEAVKLANETSKKKIQLVILGDGEVRMELEQKAPEYVHFMGTKRNVRNYFAMADAGFLPTRFKGESYPLVVIESLMSGTPVIATDIAEVRNQLTLENGNMAGELIHLNNWSLDINEISSIIVSWANDEEKYKSYLNNVDGAIKKFDIEAIVKQHLEIYEKA